ncbi:cellulose binding domain-containing protein [Luedemannella helvata]|uniref:CBM2 domain-containing protein n=1 Tax=Luedemannella helvata TaxID=349315 RepID=A0ABN2KZG2_9ACTN
MSKASRKLISAAAAVALAAVAAVTTITSAYAESNGGVRVMPLGDSITDGFNVPGGYRNGLWQRLVGGGYTVDFVGSQFNGPASLGDHDHEGHSGWRIDQLDANIVTWLRNYTPRTVLLHIGTNDITQNRDLSNAPNRLSGLIDKITSTAPNAEVFVASIIPIGYGNMQASVRSFNSAIPGIVQAKVNAGRRVHFVDMYAALTTADLADNVHPNATGYDKMAAAWYAALRSVPGSISNGTPTSTPPTTRPATSAPVTSAPVTSAAVSSRPPTSPVVTTQPVTSAPVTAGGACTATYAVVNQWPGGFQASVTVVAGAAPLTGWTVTWTFGNGQAISQAWNATVTTSGAAVTARNVSYNGNLAARASTEFGFLASATGTNSAPTLTCAAA